MGHLMKYRFKQIIRDGSSMFWALAFPIILGTFFYVSFGSGDMGEDMEVIPVAVVEEQGRGREAEAFDAFLDGMDKDTLEVREMSEKKALKELKADNIDGIFYASDVPTLTVAKSDIQQSILKALMDNYNRNAELFRKVAAKHPERMQQMMKSLGDYEELTEEVSLGGNTTNTGVQYFFALIAYACISGAFLGVKSSMDGQANISALGARRSITPTHKLKLVLTDMAVLFGIHFFNIGILTLYVRFVLGIDLGNHVGGILLTNLMGSMIGVSLGIMIGCISKMSVSIKMGICVTVTLVPGFLAGLMFSNMKDIIEHYAPIINRLNPAAVLSDAFCCMSVYNDTERFAGNLTVLGLMSLICIIIAFWAVRRERYDSI